MATHKRPTPRADPGQDSRGNVRLYADIPEQVAKEFKILAIRRGVTYRALMARLIMDAVAGK